MRDDPIVEETQAARRELNAQFGGDMAALLKYFKETEAKNSEWLVRPAPKPATLTNRRVS